MASTSDKSSTSIIKSDRIGRTRYRSEYKAEVLAAFQKSGMKGAAFAQQCGIKYPTFASWITKATEDHPRIVAWILLLIGRIYRIEAELRTQRAGPLERQKIRWLETRRTYDHLAKLFAHLHKKSHILPQSNLGKALRYACNQWEHLEPCFLDGQIEFDIGCDQATRIQHHSPHQDRHE